MNNDLEKDVNTVQNDVFASFQNVDLFAVAAPPGSVGGLIVSVSTFSSTVVESFLGDIGTRFLNFVGTVDHTHPHLFHPSAIFEGAFNLDSDVTKKIIELLELYEYAHAHGLREAMGVLSKIAAREFGHYFKDVNSPIKNQQYVRLLKTRDERDGVRKNKKIISIDLNSLAKKGEVSWSSLPKAFRFLARGSSAIKTELEKAEKMAQKYLDMRCNSLYSEVKKSIDTLKEQRSDSYYGFSKVKVADAALILAKVHGFEFVERQATASSYISIPDSFFGNYKFSLENHGSSYRYTARVYPAFELIGELKSNAEAIIDRLESFPECAGKSIFDHYVVVIPSVCHNFSYEVDGVGNKDYYFLDRDGKKIISSSVEEIQKKFDFYLIRSGYTVPVLLGEKDGKCHFLSYWTFQGDKK